MTSTHTTESPQTNTAGDKPKAIGFVRNDVSGMHAPRHALDVQRHANTLGYQYVYTVRPPADIDDPIAYALGIAAGLDVRVIVVFDLGHVNCRPALVCDEGFDLETVCPQGTWARSAQRVPGDDKGGRVMNADALLSPPTICGFAEVELAHAQMRRHRACRISRCAWKRVAYYTLVRHGRIVPPKLSPRERARLRGIEFPIDNDRPLPEGIPELRTLHQVLDGLAQLALPPTSPGCGGER